jgi:DNA-binding NarL/FixJ family response regulator
MHGSAEHVHRALRAGGRGYLLKESAGGRVAEAVRAVHAGRLFLDPDLPAELLRALRQRSVRAPTPLESLSPRERQVLQLVAEGLSSAAVAERLFLSPKTVETYRSRLMAKLGIDDLASLVKFAVRHGLTPPG